MRNKSYTSTILSIFLASVSAAAFALPVQAEEKPSELIRDGMIYTVGQDAAYVTGSKDTAAKHICIPAVIDGIPVIGVEAGCFRDCTALTEITVEGESQWLKSIDGVLFSISEGTDRMELLAYPVGRSGTYTAPEGTVSVGDQAFANAAGLTALSLPDLEWVGSGAFENCTSLQQFMEPIALTDGSSIAGCSALEELVLAAPRDGASLVNLHVDGCQALKELVIPEACTLDSTFTVRDCPQLERVQLLGKGHDRLRVLISDCEKLQTISIPNETDMQEIEIYNCGQLTMLDLSGVSVGQRTNIGASAVENCPVLQEVRMPERVYKDITFKECSALTDLYYYAVGDYDLGIGQINGIHIAGSKINVHCCTSDAARQQLCAERKLSCTLLEDKILMGDLLENGEVDIVDVIVLNKNLMIGTPLSKIGRVAADFNQDGKVDEANALGMLKHIVGLA